MSLSGPPRPISVVIIAQDEEERLAAAVRSCVAFADEILVVDGGSRDGTVALAGKLGCRVEGNPWPGYAAQRNFGAGRARHDWIFFLDADEVVGADLAEALKVWKAGPEPQEGSFAVHRIGDFMGCWIGGHDLVRLYDRRLGRVGDALVHETIQIPGQAAPGRLTGTLWHHGFRSLSDHVVRFSRYTDLEARQDFAAGRRFSLARMLLRPPARFLQRWLLRGLWKRGVPGLAASLFWLWYEVLRELKLWELAWRARGETAPAPGRGGGPADPLA